MENYHQIHTLSVSLYIKPDFYIHLLSLQFPAVVELNIGGHHFTTLLQTLTKEPGLLADMFSGKHDLMKDEHGRYFIDADGSMFAYILNFLRVEQLPPNEVASDVCRHAEYFGIQSLVSKLQQQVKEWAKL